MVQVISFFTLQCNGRLSLLPYLHEPVAEKRIIASKKINLLSSQIDFENWKDANVSLNLESAYHCEAVEAFMTLTKVTKNIGGYLT